MLKRLRPFRRRCLITRLPLAVFMRARKPDFRIAFRFVPSSVFFDIILIVFFSIRIT